MVSSSRPNEIGKLDGKVVVITGASRGIGKSIASAFAAVGAKVVLAARTRETLEQVAADLRKSGAEALAVPTDVTDANAVQRLIERTLDAYRGVDILVNNAGVGYFGPVVDFAPDDWDTVLNSNLKAVYLCAKYALPPMLARGSGQIINVLSIAAKVAFEASAAYWCSKSRRISTDKGFSRRSPAAEYSSYRCCCPVRYIPRFGMMFRYIQILSRCLNQNMWQIQLSRSAGSRPVW